MLNTGKTISYSKLRQFETIPAPVHVTVPGRISKSLEPDLWNCLSEGEQDAIKNAGEIIYKTYAEIKGD